MAEWSELIDEDVSGLAAEDMATAGDGVGMQQFPPSARRQRPQQQRPQDKIVTQAMLRQYKELRALMAEKKIVVDNLRQAILAGIEVEPGELSYHLTKRYARRITHASLTLVVGEAAARRIIALTPSTESIVIAIDADCKQF